MSAGVSPKPRLLVLSMLFPSPAQPSAGSFIRERMFRVGERLPLVVVSPQPWFPLQGLLRHWRPHFRPPAPRREKMAGVVVYRPRFLSVPGFAKHLDGFFMAVACWPLLRRLRRQSTFDVIDAHFAFPDGYAASLLGRWLRCPHTVTLRGTETRHMRQPSMRRRIGLALKTAARVFSVSDSLRQIAYQAGAEPSKCLVVGNGVDTEVFRPMSAQLARRELGLAADGPYLVTVGGLVERKGFHRVMDCLPKLRRRYPGLQYVIVGSGGPEGDWEARLRQQAAELGLRDAVHFLGRLPAERVRVALSAADLFVLSTRNEGWANVFLEAMACGLPTITTDVGGNREVVSSEDLGFIVPFDDADALRQAIDRALAHPWDREAIIAHARCNTWNSRVEILEREFLAIEAGIETGRAAPSDCPQGLGS